MRLGADIFESRNSDEICVTISRVLDQLLHPPSIEECWHPRHGVSFSDKRSMIDWLIVDSNTGDWLNTFFFASEVSGGELVMAKSRSGRTLQSGVYCKVHRGQGGYRRPSGKRFIVFDV